MKRYVVIIGTSLIVSTAIVARQYAKMKAEEAAEVENVAKTINSHFAASRILETFQSRNRYVETDPEKIREDLEFVSIMHYNELL